MTPQDHHEIRARDHDVEGSSDRSFGLVISGVLLILGGLKRLHAGRTWPIYLGVRRGADHRCAAATGLARAVEPIGTKLGFVLAKIVNPIVMGAVFFFVITPTAMLMRLRSRDILNLRADRTAASYWIVRDLSETGSMKDQF